MGKLQNKVAVVTGASKGIGAGIARALAREGAALVVSYASDRNGAEKLAAEIVADGGKALAVQADTSKPDDIKRLFAETARAFGRLDVLVNNAGVFKFAPLEETGAEEFHRQFDINVLGPILAVREAASLFGPDGGSVINVSSVASTKGMPGSVVYAGTKGALDAVTRVLANELGPRNIRVNSVAPGMIETEGTHTAGFIGGDFQKNAEAATPLGRIGKPDDVAKVVVFLASDDAGWVTGERIETAGGFR
jgi:3-oxoacyl-[acyl-carrier protein] reductase